MEIVYPVAHLAYGFLDVTDPSSTSSLVTQGVRIRCNESEQIVPIFSSVTSVFFQTQATDTFRDSNRIGRWLKLRRISHHSDIIACLKFATLKHDLMPALPAVEHAVLFQRRNFPLRKLLFRLCPGGLIRNADSYYSYARDTFIYLADLNDRQPPGSFLQRNRDFLIEFIILVLQYLRADSLFGPHCLISFFAHRSLNVPLKPLPYDLPVPPDASYSWLETNCAFLENSLALNGPLSLLWGYQTLCHKRLSALANWKLSATALSFQDIYDILELRIRHSAGAHPAQTKLMIEFAALCCREHIPRHDWLDMAAKRPIPMGILAHIIKAKETAENAERKKESPMPDEVAINFSPEDLPAIHTNAPETEPEEARTKFSDYVSPALEAFMDALRKDFAADEARFLSGVPPIVVPDQL
jgi:hypothetical protein